MKNYNENLNSKSGNPMNNSTRTLLTLAAGAVAGAVTALLLAPSSGEETRRAIARNATNLKNSVTDTIQQGLDKIGSLTGGAAEEATDELATAGNNAGGATGRRQNSTSRSNTTTGSATGSGFSGNRGM
jgi:gas vesicle protein